METKRGDEKTKIRCNMNKQIKQRTNQLNRDMTRRVSISLRCWEECGKVKAGGNLDIRHRKRREG